jgi:hypothetical protein
LVSIGAFTERTLSTIARSTQTAATAAMGMGWVEF